MFQKIFLTLVTLANLAGIYSVQYYSAFIPFYIFAGCYLGTIILIVGYYSIVSNKSSELERLAFKLFSSGNAVVYSGFLAVIDLIMFILLVPTASISLLESDLQTPFVILALIIFFVPVILIKLLIEPPGKAFEDYFWFELLENMKKTKPSSEFALFIITRIQIKSLPLSKRQANTQDFKVETNQMDEGISTTTFPLDYSTNISHENLDQSKNSLFDSEEELSKENAFDQYYKEIYRIVPGIEELVNHKPVKLREDLLLNIIIERTARNQQILKFFKDCSDYADNLPNQNQIM